MATTGLTAWVRAETCVIHKAGLIRYLLRILDAMARTRQPCRDDFHVLTP